MTMYFDIIRNEILIKEIIDKQKKLTAKTGYMKDVSTDTEHLVEAFLIDHTWNKNNWKVTKEAIKKDINKFIGIPGIYYVVCESGKCETDHTPVNSNDIEKIMKQQKPYVVSKIIKIRTDENTGIVYAVHKILDDKFGQLIKDKKIKFTSPGIIPDAKDTTIKEDPDGGLPLTIANSFEPFHSAWLENDPAYGTDKAKIVNECDGGESCIHNMLTAKCDTGDCPTTQLKKLEIGIKAEELKRKLDKI